MPTQPAQTCCLFVPAPCWLDVTLLLATSRCVCGSLVGSKPQEVVAAAAAAAALLVVQGLSCCRDISKQPVRLQQP